MRRHSKRGLAHNRACACVSRHWVLARRCCACARCAAPLLERRTFSRNTLSASPGCSSGNSGGASSSSSAPTLFRSWKLTSAKRSRCAGESVADEACAAYFPIFWRVTMTSLTLDRYAQLICLFFAFLCRYIKQGFRCQTRMFAATS